MENLNWFSAFLSHGKFKLVMEKSLNFIAQFLYRVRTGLGNSLKNGSVLENSLNFEFLAFVLEKSLIFSKNALKIYSYP